MPADRLSSILPSYMSLLRQVVKHPEKVVRGLRNRGIRWYVKARNGVGQEAKPPVDATGHLLFEEVRQFALKRSDISDHLPRIFAATLRHDPSLIVELGVRGGASTFVFERVAGLTGSHLVSVDLDDCTGSSSFSDWHFIQGDDIAIAKRFPEWCRERGIDPRIDVLFIDTSHVYEHTVEEIDHWFPCLSERALVIFHDTNMREVYTRNDGSVGQGWSNDRGVIRAIEEYFGRSFDETVDFVHVEPQWTITHYAKCNGLTFLERFPARSANGNNGAE